MFSSQQQLPLNHRNPKRFVLQRAGRPREWALGDSGLGGKAVMVARCCSGLGGGSKLGGVGGSGIEAGSFAQLEAGRLGGWVKVVGSPKALVARLESRDAGPAWKEGKKRGHGRTAPATRLADGSNPRRADA